MTLTGEQRAKVDEYGRLKASIPAAVYEKIKAGEILRKEIESWYAGQPAEDEFVARGRRWQVLVSARAMKRTIINMNRLCEFLGIAKFLVLCAFRLEDVDRYVPDPQRAEVLKIDRTGPRTVGAPTPVERASSKSARPIAA